MVKYSHQPLLLVQLQIYISVCVCTCAISTPHDNNVLVCSSVANVLTLATDEQTISNYNAVAVNVLKMMCMCLFINYIIIL